MQIFETAVMTGASDTVVIAEKFESSPKRRLIFFLSKNKRHVIRKEKTVTRMSFVWRLSVFDRFTDCCLGSMKSSRV